MTYMWAAEPETNALTVAAFVVALLGLAGALTSLVWQFVTFQLAGGRAKVEMRIGAMDNAGVVTYQPNGSPPSKEQTERLIKQGLTTPVLHVKVRSVGRIPVSVVTIQWCTSAKVNAAQLSAVLGPPLPCRLEAGHVEDWYADVNVGKSLRAAAEALGHSGQIRMWVEVTLGTGRKVRGKGWLLV